MQEKVLKDNSGQPDQPKLIVEEVKGNDDGEQEDALSSLPNDVYFEDFGKSFLHLAVEHTATDIISFLLFKTQVDPNVLTHNT